MGKTLRFALWFSTPEAPAHTAPRWQAEYTFTREWRLPSANLPSLERLYRMITTMPKDRRRWHLLFAAPNPVYWPLNRGGGPRR